MRHKCIYRSAQQSGFTLIELGIAIAIIGILAAIAISQYQVYLGRSQSVRVINELGQLRINIEECIQTGTTIIGREPIECNPHAPASTLLVGNSQVGTILPAGMGVAQVTDPLTLTTNIMGVLSDKAMPILSGKKVIWARAIEGSWYCISSIEAKYLPKYCQHDASI